jgi:hypothetical protein
MDALLTLNVFALSLPAALLGAALFGALIALPLVPPGSRPQRIRCGYKCAAH